MGAAGAWRTSPVLHFYFKNNAGDELEKNEYSQGQDEEGKKFFDQTLMNQCKKKAKEEAKALNTNPWPSTHWKDGVAKVTEDKEFDLDAAQYKHIKSKISEADLANSQKVKYHSHFPANTTGTKYSEWFHVSFTVC